MNNARALLVCVLALLCLVSAVSAHICILHPHQRGTLDVSIPGSPACYRRTSYCGGVATEAPSTSFVAGEVATVLLQQNLNHFWHSAPGYLDIALSYSLQPTDSDWIILDRWDDWAGNDMVWQTNFTREVRMPSQTSAHCILRTRYVSHNQDEVDPPTNHEAIFYNCADIALVGNSTSASASLSTTSASASHSTSSTSSSVRSAAAASAHDCCTPAQWTAYGYSDQAGLATTKHTIYYDGKAQLVRWDREVQGGGTLITFSNYTSVSGRVGGPYLEFLYRPQEGTCEAYGADRFYDWCYGSQRGMQFSGQFGTGPGGVTVNEYRDSTNQMRFYATSTCLPLGMHHQQYNLQFRNWGGAPEASVFRLPLICQQAASDVSLIACGHQEKA